MKNPHRGLLFFLLLGSLNLAAAFAQQEINLDDLSPKPAPDQASQDQGGASSLDSLFGGTETAPKAPAKDGEINLDDLSSPAQPARSAGSRQPSGGSAQAALGAKVNLYADFDFNVLAPIDFGKTPIISFLQNHTAILIKALYGGDQASMMVDALHADQLFELGLNASLFGPAFSGLPIIGTSSWRFGRILVPFGDYEFHHLYGGYVDEKNVLFSKLWSDLGISWKMTLMEGLESELFLGNGFASTGDNPSFLPQPSADADPGKAVAFRFRWMPTPASFLLASLYLDPWGADGESGRYLYLAGLDLGNKFGPLGLKAGGFFGQVFGALPKDYFHYASYLEAKYTFDSTWAVRFRGGHMNPDSRARDITDQWNVNLGLICSQGPLTFEILYFLNQEIYHFGDPSEPNNYHQLLVKCLLTI